MGLKCLLLHSLFLYFFHCRAISSYQDDDYDASFYNIRAYPTYHGALKEDIMQNNGKVDKSEFIKMVNEKEDNGGAFSNSKLTSTNINVDDYGAKGDGSDATKAFEDAWSKVCSSTSPSTLVVPSRKNYLLKPITFHGPCKSNVTVKIMGTIQAPTDRSIWGKNTRQWILFNRVDNLYVGGGGTINGNGKIWWENSCKVDKSKPCTVAPTAITFYSSKNLQVAHLNVIDAQQMHMRFEKLTNVKASSIKISAPETSPNTDGIHITATRNMVLDKCNIGTGDDCISIVDGAKGVKISNIECGPGHGISIGSLGAHNEANYVSDITVDTAQLNGPSNGVRIKTWQGGRGYAKDIRFQNIKMNNVKNPIIIDQDYCDSDKPCKQQKNAVKISNISYINIKGTSASDKAMIFECSKSFPCERILLQNINLVKVDGETAITKCENVHFTTKGSVTPAPCAS